MANYRQIHTSIWHDEWFLNLPTERKLLFIYLFSNDASNLAGVYKIPLRVIGFDTGLLHEDIIEALKDFESDGKIVYSDGWIWIVNLREYNPVGAPGFKNVLRNVQKLPPGKIRDRYLLRYPEFTKYIDTLSIPYSEGVENSINLTKLNLTNHNNRVSDNGDGWIFKLYESEIGVISPTISDDLQDMEKDYLKDWIEASFRIAVQNNKRNIAYIRGILKRWKADGQMSILTKAEKAAAVNPDDLASEVY